MAYYTQEEYFNMIMAYSAADQDPSAAVRVYRQRHPDAGRFPSADTIARLVRRLRTGHGNIIPTPATGLVDRAVDYYPPPLVRLVIAQFHEDENISTRIVAARLNVAHHDTVYRIAKDNGFQCYKFTKVQKLMGEDDYLARRVFCVTFRANLHANRNLLRYVLWSDECLFTPNGMFNSKNFVTWTDEENPLAYRELRHQYRWSLMVWAGIIYGQIVSKLNPSNKILNYKKISY